ncbi:unnamed protein product [Ectocarpus sp. 6 AP-2014]
MPGRWLSRLTLSGVGTTQKRARDVGGARACLSGKASRTAATGRWLQQQQAVGTNGATTAAVRWRSTTSAGRNPRAIRPPNPRRDARGDDEYRWMHDIGSEEVLRHLEHENRYSAAYLRPLHRRASELFRRMVDRQPEEEGGDSRSVPERLGDFLYYTRRDDGKGFPIYVRRPVEGTLDDEQVVFDLNEVEERGLGDIGCGDRGGGGDSRDEEGTSSYCGGEEDEEELGAASSTPALGAMKLSPDQRMLACTLDMDGSDRFVLAVFDLLGGGRREDGDGGKRQGPTVALLREDAMWDDVIGVEWGSTWSPQDLARDCGGGGGGDDAGSGESGLKECSLEYELFYTVPDHLRRPWQVRRVVIHRTTSSAESAGRTDDACGGGGTGKGWRVESASDRSVFEEKDDAFFVDVGKTKDHSFVVINVHSKTTSEVYLLPGSTSPKAGRGSAAGVEGKAATAAADAAAAAAASHEHECAGPTLLRRRRQGVEYYVDHSGDAFFIVTNSPPSKNGGVEDRHGRSGTPRSSAVDAGEYRLVRVPLQQQQHPGRGGRGGDASSCSSSLEGVADVPWEAVPCGRLPGTVQEMDLFRDHCVLYETCPASGCPRLRVVPLAHSSPAPAAGGDGRVPSPFVVSPPNAGGRCGDSVGDSVGDDESVSDSASDGGSLCASGPVEQGAPAASAAAGGATASSAACTLRPGVNSWFEARTARFSLSSPTAPEDVYDVCLESGRVELLRRTEVPGSPRFDGRDYSCYTTRVPSHDREMVPLTIVHRRGIELDGKNRLLLHGYGSYGMSLPIDYHPAQACMLERGWVLAFAHVRGGGERGKAWHAGGRGLDKWNSFWDFEACAEHLVSGGFTSPSLMGAQVNSAGGLLAGVMANQRPGLFSAMVMKAPFLGVLSAMRDSSLPLTVHEFDEWGDPNSSAEVESVIRSYCPYENVVEQEYPALLVTASLNDNRVNVWDPAKWVSRVRAANTGQSPVLLRVSESDGHHGPGNTLDGLKDSALEMAFLEKHLKVC